MIQQALFADQWPINEARELRDEGMARTIQAERAEWKANHDKEFALFLQQFGDRPFLAEQFRSWFLNVRQNPPPHHPNVWGACWNGLVRSGKVKWTGTISQAASSQSHGHHYKVWVKG